MDIQSTGGISGPDPIQPARIPSKNIQPSSTPAPSSDRAEISSVARYLSMLREVPPIRQDKVDALRALIEAGQFETPERIAGAVDRILEELG